MSIKISEPDTAFVVVHKQESAHYAQTIRLNSDEQRELLEALARIHGMSLVDREERRSLLALAEEVDDDPNDYSTGSEAWGAWQDRAEALASAVSSALKED